MAIFNDNFHLHIHLPGLDGIDRKLDLIIQNQNKMALSIADLSAKADLLQTTIDETQAAALEKISTLETTVQELRDVIAAGGDQTQLQAVADKLDNATADLKSTFPAAEPAPEG